MYEDVSASELQREFESEGAIRAANQGALSLSEKETLNYNGEFDYIIKITSNDINNIKILSKNYGLFTNNYVRYKDVCSMIKSKFLARYYIHLIKLKYF